MALTNLYTDHKQRIDTAVLLLAAIILIGIFNNFFVIWLTLGIIYITAFKEANALFGVENKDLYLLAGVLWMAAAFYPKADDLFLLSALIGASYYAYNPKTDWKNILGFLYPTAGMLFMLTLYVNHGIYAIFWMLMIVAGADVGAYVVGKSFGKTKFSDTSPNKTMEGVAGGIGIATVLGYFVGMGMVDGYTAVMVSVTVAVSAVFGDLFESFLKRRAGVKDSGTFLPGHGGALDRIDGYLFGSVVMVVLLRGMI
ncbi:phosphatidate cytidylyltransferase [Sulfurimonas sp. HSL3-7]|uniref:phosphatidate cytidylyltransferase n=1 Tax=Sulfonitrofixus jiaomeiensis TaxID=3131938 RepID=UPI0031F7B622